jgi:Trk-type K+ transport system membrane component
MQHFQSHIAMKSMLPSSEVVRIIKEKLQHLHEFLSMRLSCISKCANYFFRSSFMVFQRNPLLAQIIYFMSISLFGFLGLKNLKPQHNTTPRSLDLIFTSVSTLTVSSMATVEMEDFSDRQLWVLILLMLLGGEVFTSILGVVLKKAKAHTDDILQKSLPSTCRDIEFSDALKRCYSKNSDEIHSGANISHNQVQESKGMSKNFSNILAHVVAGYFVVGIISSSLIVIICIWVDSNTKDLLKSKNINIWTFSIFTAVSSFVNCGFTPLNDNMASFRKNPSLLLLIIPQILAGNTLFTPFLRLSIWALGKIRKREEYAYILEHPEETGYRRLQHQKTSINLVLTSVAVILLQVIFLCYFGWNSKPLEELNWFQKVVCLLFQSVNTRQAGEAIIDISTLSPPILALFALIMSVSHPTPVHSVKFSNNNNNQAF